MTIVTNPDKKKEFKVWHFCGTCLARWKDNEHEDIKDHVHNDIRTISTRHPFAIIRA